jgi:hypothetical protein
MFEFQADLICPSITATAADQALAVEDARDTNMPSGIMDCMGCHDGWLEYR